MMVQLSQGLLCFVVALLHHVTPAPVTKSLTSSNPANSSKSTQKLTTSSKTAVPYIPTVISTTPHPSTGISIVTSSKQELFGKLYQIKEKVAKTQAKIDGGLALKHHVTTATPKSVKSTSTATTAKSKSTTIAQSRTATTVQSKTTPITTTNNTLTSFIPNSTTIPSPPLSKTTSSGDPIKSQNSTVTLPTVVATATNTTTTKLPEGNSENNKDVDDGMERYDYDEEDDWFHENDLIWDFDEDKSFEDEYDQLYDPSSGGNYRQLFEETKKKIVRLPWE